MKVLRVINLVLIVLLSASSALAKIMLMPQEVEFFGQAGLSKPMLVAFGSLQMLAALLFVTTKLRKAGAILAALAFLGSAITIFISGNTAFGLISLLPVALSTLIIFHKD